MRHDNSQPTNWLYWKSRVVPGTLHAPIDWAAEFGRSTAVEVEIGAGNGLWLRSYAAANPDRDLIGIELVGKFVLETNRRTLRDKQTNIRLFAGDARMIVAMVFADCSIGRVFVNFPDPWFKKRHLKRRLLNPTYLRLLSKKMRIGADLVIASDDADYVAFTRESVAEVPEFTPMFTGTHLESVPDYPQTKYEKKWRGMGREIYYLRYENSRNAVIADLEYFQDQRLEHALHLLGEKIEIPTVIQPVNEERQ